MQENGCFTRETTTISFVLSVKCFGAVSTCRLMVSGFFFQSNKHESKSSWLSRVYWAVYKLWKDCSYWLDEYNLQFSAHLGCHAQMFEAGCYGCLGLVRHWVTTGLYLWTPTLDSSFAEKKTPVHQHRSITILLRFFIKGKLKFHRYVWRCYSRNWCYIWIQLRVDIQKTVRVKLYHT